MSSKSILQYAGEIRPRQFGRPEAEQSQWAGHLSKSAQTGQRRFREGFFILMISLQAPLMTLRVLACANEYDCSRAQLVTISQPRRPPGRGRLPQRERASSGESLWEIQ